MSTSKIANGTVFEDMSKEANFAQVLLISIYITMLICVFLLLFRILYIAIIRNLERPLRTTPTLAFSSVSDAQSFTFN